MKKILITGANSYVGTNVEKWLGNASLGTYQADTVSVRGEAWKDLSFSEYDVVFHVAGIAHVSANPKMKDLYFAVNRDLTLEVAKKAKEDGVKQFIFMSSIIVYGSSARVGKEKKISADTKEQPADFYGQSKLEAERGLFSLESAAFKVAAIRAPMIYGKDAKGNYRRLAALALKTPVFPNIQNCRSQLFVDNLCEFVRLLIENESRGIFYPQNREYVTTSEMAKAIAAVYGKRLRLTKLFNPAIRFGGRFVGIINKVFGNMAYEKEMSAYWEYQYCVADFMESIKRTEGKL